MESNLKKWIRKLTKKKEKEGTKKCYKITLKRSLGFGDSGK